MFPGGQTSKLEGRKVVLSCGRRGGVDRVLSYLAWLGRRGVPNRRVRRVRRQGSGIHRKTKNTYQHYGSARGTERNGLLSVSSQPYRLLYDIGPSCGYLYSVWYCSIVTAPHEWMNPDPTESRQDKTITNQFTRDSHDHDHGQSLIRRCSKCWCYVGEIGNTQTTQTFSLLRTMMHQPNRPILPMSVIDPAHRSARGLPAKPRPRREPGTTLSPEKAPATA